MISCKVRMDCQVAGVANVVILQKSSVSIIVLCIIWMYLHRGDVISIGILPVALKLVLQKGQDKL
jgi:hypothetical protein